MNITLKNGDMNLLLKLLNIIWADLLPPLRDNIISCATVEDANGVKTLLLFNEDDQRSRETIGPCNHGNDFTEIVAFIQDWLKNDGSLAKPADDIGGSHFKGFWLSNENLKNHDYAKPFLAIRSAWPYYEKQIPEPPQSGSDT